MTAAAAHPLGAFKVTASVDWLRLRLTTPRPTQARHLRAKLPAGWRPFVDPAPGSDPNACSSWSLTIQDPPRTAVIAKTLLNVMGLHPDQIATDAIEVSLDFLPRGQNAYSRLDHAAYHLHRHHAHPPPGTPRITEPGRFRAAAGQRDIVQALRDGFTINTGNRDADHRSRVYVKRKDSDSDGQYRPLPQTQHRARLEVTLAGAPLHGLAANLAALTALRFETLTDRFALVMDSETTAAPLTAMLRPLQTQRGRARTPGSRRLSQRGTRRDTTTNKRIHDALRSLTSRQSNAEISGQKPDLDTASPEGNDAENSDSPEYLICQTTGTTLDQPDHQHQQPGRTRPEGADGPTQANPDQLDSTSVAKTATGPDGQQQQGPAGQTPSTTQDAQSTRERPGRPQGQTAAADLTPLIWNVP